MNVAYVFISLIQCALEAVGHADDAQHAAAAGDQLAVGELVAGVVDDDAPVFTNIEEVERSVDEGAEKADAEDEEDFDADYEEGDDEFFDDEEYYDEGDDFDGDEE